MSYVDNSPNDASDTAQPSNASAVSLAFLSLRGIFFRLVIFKQSLKATFHQSTCRPHIDHSTSTHHSRHVVRHHQHAALRVRQLPEGLHLPERGPELQLHQEVRIGPWGTWPPIPPPIATSSVNEPTRHHHNVGRMSEVSLSVSYFGTSATIRQSNPPPHRLHHYAHLAKTKRPRFPTSIISSGINWRCADRTKAHGNPCPKKNCI